MKIIDIFRSRIVIFALQFLILSLFIFILSYKISLEFDTETTKEQELIIQFLGNYVLFNKLSGLSFVYIIWLTVSFIPIIVYLDFKKAYSMNLLSFFFLNFFLYVFLRRHSRPYFDTYFQFHFINTLLLGYIIFVFSIVLSLIFKKIKIRKSSSRIVNLETIAKSISTVCPQCRTEFESRPKICFNCSADLTLLMEDSSE